MCVCVCVLELTYVRMYVFMYVCVYIYMSVHTYVFMYVCKVILSNFLISITCNRYVEPEMYTHSVIWSLLIGRQHPGLK